MLNHNYGKERKGSTWGKERANYTEDPSLWIARSEYNLKDGKSVWNNTGKKRVPEIFSLWSPSSVPFPIKRTAMFYTHTHRHTTSVCTLTHLGVFETDDLNGHLTRFNLILYKNNINVWASLNWSFLKNVSGFPRLTIWLA